MKTNSDLFIRNLGNGLILRRASSLDAEALADINGRMHSDEGPEKPNTNIAAWVHDLVARPHPTTQAGDFTVVEEVATGRIVSTLCLISQTWLFDGIEFAVGRPELVCTLPEFRKLGLVRAQMNEVHKWSANRQQWVQAITGIPNFYRQFGYGMALNLSGGRRGFEPHVPLLKDGEEEPIGFRKVLESDLDFIVKTYEQAENLYAISCRRTTEIMRYELFGKSELNITRTEKKIIEDVRGNAIGFFEHSTDLWMGAAVCQFIALAKGASWFDVLPGVVRFLWQQGDVFAKRDGSVRTAFGFNLGEYHPVYDVLEDRLPQVRKPYAYYMRVVDVPAFLLHIRPALEARLAASVAAGYSGVLRLGFYKSGVSLFFEQGLLTAVEPFPISTGVEVDAAFPDQTFLQLLFGQRTFDELRHIFADCYAQNQTAKLLLNGLFPKRLSNVISFA